MQPEDKTVLKDGECPWCHHNEHPPGIMWKVNMATYPNDGSISGTSFVPCGHCPDGQQRQKEEALRNLLRSQT